MKNTISLGIDAWEQAAELLDLPEEGEDRSGWIFTGRGTTGWEVRRIPYLANLRNQAMEPLLAMSPGLRFEKVLWINDVVFQVCASSFIPPSSSFSASHFVICCIRYVLLDRVIELIGNRDR